MENKVAAPFHFTDPWWKICILRTRFTKGERTRFPKDTTSLTYRIRKDDKVVRDKLVNMFLTMTLVNSPNDNDARAYIDEFLQFIE